MAALPANKAWYGLVQDLLKSGKEVSPRGLLTKEFVGYTSTIDMRWPVVTYPMRKLNYKFMAGEAWWILSGLRDVASIAEFNSKIAQYSDDGETFFGAYGPRIMGQIEGVVNTLLDDPDSRQAVLTIWRENPPKTKDVPCTVAMQFMIRKGHLHVNVFMRSSDIWIGWCYDVFVFSMVAMYVIKRLTWLHNLRHNDPSFDLRLGHLNLTAGSQHLYESNFAAAELIINQCSYDAPQLQLAKMIQRQPDAEAFIEDLGKIARQPTNGDVLRSLVDAP